MSWFLRAQADSPFANSLSSSYFDHFEGHQDCDITSGDLYRRPSKSSEDGQKLLPYCKNRATLLEALSGGGRHGFDAPFYPAGCYYRWYSTAEICMILDRFDAIVFIGDGMLQNIYAGFNMLLRENIATGGLKQWKMKENERTTCRCDNQIIKSECSAYNIKNSQEVRESAAEGGRHSPFYCDRKAPSSSTALLFLHLLTVARYSPPLPSHIRFSRPRLSSSEIQHNSRRQLRLIQTCTSRSLALPQHVPLVALCYCVHG